MKFLTIFVTLCVLAGCALSQTDTTEYQPETTDSHYWDPDTTTARAETTALPITDQQPCGFAGPCGKVPKDAKKMYFFF